MRSKGMPQQPGQRSTDDLFGLIDELKARLDAGAASWDQNAEITDIYGILDRIAEGDGGRRGFDRSSGIVRSDREQPRTPRHRWPQRGGASP